MLNLEIAFDLSSEMYCVLDKDFKIQVMNQRFETVLNLTKDKAIGLSFIELLSENEDKNSFCQLLNKIKEKRTKLTKFDLIITPDTSIHVRARIQKNGNYYYMIANQVILQDAPLARFRRFFDLSLLDILVIANKERKIVYSNKNLAKILGFPWEEIQNIPFENLISDIHTEETISFMSNMESTQKVAQAITTQCIHKTNGSKWVSWRMIYAKSNFYIVGYDITERKKQEIEIQQLLEKTMSLNKNLEQQNSELVDSRSELQTTLSELEIRNYELDQFVYKVSHDLRSPLTSIMGLINLAVLELDNPEMTKEYFKMIEKSIFKLDNFVQSLLDYSQSNRIEGDIERIDFDKLVADTLENWKFSKNYDIIEKDIQINLSNEVYSENIRLKILLNNIISNAIKYQSPHRETQILKIHIDDTIGQNQVRIIIEDNGIGILEEYKNQVFDMFYRATESSQGSGLGLYIVKQTITKMNGKIELESEYGKYTKFTLTFPNLKDKKE